MELVKMCDEVVCKPVETKMHIIKCKNCLNADKTKAAFKNFS